MKWISIKKNEVDAWNEKLKTTTASFFQYPYYAAGYRHFLFSKPVFLQLTDAEKITGYCCIMQISFLFLKIGLVMRGPVFFDSNNDIKNSIEALKIYAKKHAYIFFRINPNDFFVEEILAASKGFVKRDFFPLYKGAQGKDLVVYKKSEQELFKSFRESCRHKIRYQDAVGYTYSQVKNEDDLKKVYHLFRQLGELKKFSFRPFKAYRSIYFSGIKYDLCRVYTASLYDELICAIFLVKEANRCTYFSGALVLKKIQPKFSPANNLHYLAMKDCFYEDNKEEYNLSYSTPGSGVHTFKSSFRPVELDKPSFYTYVINKKLAGIIRNMQGSNMKKIRTRLRKLTYIFRK